ncbi:hypothetical protein HK096_000058, partial [Nowakowskiella sp. JEL0078]
PVISPSIQNRQSYLSAIYDESSDPNTHNSFAESSDRLSALFRPPNDIMYKEPFDKARKKAVKESKWIMITIQETSEFQCQVMNRDLWSKPAVKDMIRENFVFSMWNALSPEGSKHSTFYPFSKFPYVAIIDPLTGERTKIWNNVIDEKDFLMEVHDFLALKHSEKKQSSSASKGKQRKKLDEMTEEEQLDFALQESLFTEEVIDVDAVMDPFESIKAVVSKEPTSQDAIRIQFRWPDGSRVVHKFLKTDPVRVLFEFAKASAPNPEGHRFE